MLSIAQSRHSRRWIIAASVAFGLIALIVLGGIIWYINRPMTPVVITHSVDRPSEDKQAAVSHAWRGPGDYPARLTIPSINVDAPVQNVGIDQRREVAVPDNIHFVGWFVDSKKPGELGHSIIDGHVNGASNTAGVFARLGSLQAGNEFTIERGDATKLTYKVIGVQEVAHDEAANTLFSQEPGVKSQLSLITCSGTYSEQIKTFDKRTIVRAELIS